MKKIIAVAVLLLAGCSPEIRVYTDTDPDYDLWTYRTFDWAERTNIEANKNPLHYNELNDKRIKSAMLRELQLRGYQLSVEKPDLVLHYHIIVSSQTAIGSEPFGDIYAPAWMQERTNVYAYREGTLIIDMMDAKTKNLIWRGWAVTPIDGVNTSEKTDELIRLAVSKIFKKFPAKVKPQAIALENATIN